ncbi:exosortase-associated protein EpsI, B-type [Piscinibacter gummiphilus]|uniref:EpsI family protein n=1 Tax=Piscinibacter gummiphilus TaxID=946333 RepID=A0ABZ0CXU9_9BURK|nr:exosortase-associated protein EpsI, B-type [Piscinibacter gummiphilus]WOB07304.1 EpsI family protein [Piscinibacter gummiphilus]
MVSRLRIAAVLATLMCSASVILAFAPQPQALAARKEAPSILLEQAIPQQFGNWRLDPAQSVLVVNPQTQQLLDKLYGQVLTRTYVSPSGYRIMLSVAYGNHQRGAMQAHKPEVCYPAQGFNLLHSESAEIGTPYGAIPGRRMSTHKGSHFEPVTYWFTLGEQAVRSRFEQRVAEIRSTLTGQIPDGLLFRVSSIDTDTKRAYAEHDRFVADLLGATATADRVRLSGLSGTGGHAKTL